VAKKQHHEEHENHERWLVSYADFITLLFAFFVVMYSVSRVDNKRLVQVATAIRFAMHFQGNGGVGQLPIFDGPVMEGGSVANVSSNPPSSDEQITMQAIRKRLEKRLRNYVQARPDLVNAVVVQVEGRRLAVRLSATRFFDPAQAAIRPEVIPILDAITTELASLRRPMRIEGHTDPSPLTGSRFRDNWELSASRAAAVASYVNRAHKIDGKMLSAVGMGASRPIGSNDTTEGREMNRRVEMVVELNPGDTLDSLGR
jgi:chemotaxis protein MotB